MRNISLQYPSQEDLIVLLMKGTPTLLLPEHAECQSLPCLHRFI